MKFLNYLCLTLTIIGAIVWGLIGFLISTSYLHYSEMLLHSPE